MKKFDMRIPKIAYFYWGGEILPYLRYLTLYTFKKYNPDWNIVLYVPKKLQKKLSWGSSEQKFTKEAKDYFSWINKLSIKVIEFDMEKIGLSNDLSEVHKSDYLRWYLLGTVGGIWSDMDIIYFKPIQNLISNIQVMVCHNKGVWSIGFLGSSPNNKFYRKVFEEAKKRTDFYRYQCIGCNLLNQVYGSFLFSTRGYPEYKFKNLSMSVVYPVTAHQVQLIYSKPDLSYIRNDTIGLHWYAGHKLSGEYIGLLDHNIVKTCNNLLTWAIQKAG